MRLYDCQTAPSPRRARILIAEKGLEVETVEVDLGRNAQLEPAFRALNPRCTVPVLQLDDGTCLTENAGIAAYLEALVPDPPMLGRSPVEKGLVAAWTARIELEGFLPIADAFRNHARGLAGRALTGPTSYAQIPELAERGRARGIEFFDMLNARLGESEYVAGDAYSWADITAFVIADFAGWVKLGIGEGHVHARRWYDRVAERPAVRG